MLSVFLLARLSWILFIAKTQKKKKHTKCCDVKVATYCRKMYFNKKPTEISAESLNLSAIIWGQLGLLRATAMFIVGRYPGRICETTNINRLLRELIKIFDDWWVVLLCWKKKPKNIRWLHSVKPHFNMIWGHGIKATPSTVKISPVSTVTQNTQTKQSL